MPDLFIFLNAYDSTSALLSNWEETSVNELEMLTPSLNLFLPRFFDNDIPYSAKAHPGNSKTTTLAFSVQRLDAATAVHQTTTSITDTKSVPFQGITHSVQTWL